MFTPNSRYYDSPILIFTGPDGRELPYVSRRFAPQGQDMPLLMEVTTTQDDRLDLIATRTLGDPEQSWRICDANNAMNPADLAVPAGRRLRVPVPYPQQTGIGQPLTSPLQNIVGGMNLLPTS
jgi:hypothetical protein